MSIFCLRLSFILLRAIKFFISLFSLFRISIGKLKELMDKYFSYCISTLNAYSEDINPPIQKGIKDSPNLLKIFIIAIYKFHYANSY